MKTSVNTLLHNYHVSYWFKTFELSGQLYMLKAKTTKLPTVSLNRGNS